MAFGDPEEYPVLQHFFQLLNTCAMGISVCEYAIKPSYLAVVGVIILDLLKASGTHRRGYVLTKHSPSL